jgi:hypothetical protein
LKSVVIELIEFGVKVEDEDTKTILLNSLSSSFNNVVFTLSQMWSQTLDEIISSLFEKEKRLNARDTKGDSQTEMCSQTLN